MADFLTGKRIHTILEDSLVASSSFSVYIIAERKTTECNSSGQQIYFKRHSASLTVMMYHIQIHTMKKH